VILVRRFLSQSVACVGVLAALAVLDFSPRAAAAYQPVAGDTTPARLGSDADVVPDLPDHRLPPAPTYKPVYAEHQSAGGSLTPSGSGGGNHPPPGWVPAAEPPPPNLVVYSREPDPAVDTSVYIDSFLDPPRAG
jgi:hypothetical protein